jgi:hypothetical protein
MKPKKLAFTLDLMVYPFDVHFSFNETDEELNRWLDKHELGGKKDKKICEYETDTSPARCVMFKGNQALIRMRKLPETAADYATLQHEICHYVMFLLYNKFSMPHNMDTTEAYAYLTGYITGEVYDQINSICKRSNSKQEKQKQL